MVNSFENYLKYGKVKSKTPDPEEARALLQQAKDRLDYVKGKGINEKNAKFVLEDSYEVIREAAQSLMSIKGFKPYSHEATISFIREFHKNDFNSEEIEKFDYFRRLRNDSIYKAVVIVPEDAKDSLIFAELFVVKINSFS